jgi:hypothetical protein
VTKSAKTGAPNVSHQQGKKEQARDAALRCLGLLEAVDASSLQQLPGGASTRQFFRVQLAGRSAILMLTPLPDQAIAQSQQVSGIEPFCEVAELLREAGVNVPEIFHQYPDEGAVVVEDLGPHTLEERLILFPEEKQSLYTQILAELAEAQNRLEVLPANSCVRDRAFDHALLQWELEHFKEWAILAQGIDLSLSEENSLSTATHYLSRTISAWPRGFCHRDFQSRNLMIGHDEKGDPRVTWIDFQDAMLGPRVYDLVALLTDSYQAFSRDFIQARLQEYCSLRGFDLAPIEREFDLVTVQRKLKDAGRFLYFAKVRGNDSYLQFVVPTLDVVANTLGRLGDVDELQGLQPLISKARQMVSEART